MLLQGVLWGRVENGEIYCLECISGRVVICIEISKTTGTIENNCLKWLLRSSFPLPDGKIIASKNIIYS